MNDDIQVGDTVEVLKDTSIPWAKRAILKRALYRQQTEGNFWAFMHPDTQPQPA
jgi:hypothetical protein